VPVPRFLGVFAAIAVTFGGLGPAAAERFDWVALYWQPPGADAPWQVLEALSAGIDSPRVAAVVVRGTEEGLVRTVLRHDTRATERTPIHSVDSALHTQLRWVVQSLPASGYLLVVPSVRGDPACSSPEAWTPAHGWVRDPTGARTPWGAGLDWDFDLVIVRGCPGPDEVLAAGEGLFVHALSLVSRRGGTRGLDVGRAAISGPGPGAGGTALVVSREGSIATLEPGPLRRLLGSRSSWPVLPTVRAVASASLIALAPLLCSLLAGVGIELYRRRRVDREAEPEDPDEAAAEALRSLASRPLDAAAVAALRGALRSLSPPIVAAAVDVVLGGEVEDVEVLIPELARLPRVTAPDVLARAGAALLATGHAGGERLLLSLLRRGDPHLCSEVIAVLGRLGSVRAIGPMVEHAGRRQRRQVAAAVAAIQDRVGDLTAGGLSYEAAEVRAALGRLTVSGREGGLMLERLPQECDRRSTALH
jgi:hypothetical protein